MTLRFPSPAWLAALALFSALASAGCYFTRSPSRPVPALEFRRDAYERQPCLVVFVPGFLDGPETYLDNRFPHALNGSDAMCDAVAVDLHYRYYGETGVADVLYDDVIVPAIARGYDEIWLVGISMGGLGVLLTAAQHAELITGVVLISPFVGEESTLHEIREAGGAADWDPPPGIEDAPWTRDNYTAHLWAWLQRYESAPGGLPPIYVGWGDDDRLGEADELLGDLLPRGHVFHAPGGHGWATWGPIWQRILREAPVGQLHAHLRAH